MKQDGHPGTPTYGHPSGESRLALPLSEGVRVEEFTYSFPPELIAPVPIEPRDAARLLVYDRAREAQIHAQVRHLAQFLRREDCLVINTTEVLPARLSAKKPTGGMVEVLLLQEERAGCWQALIHGRVRPGMILRFPGETSVELLEHRSTGSWLLGCQDGYLKAAMEQYGQPPLPPYIRRPPVGARDDREHYQTVYAKEPGSVAAPTAGFHFTESLLRRLEEHGIHIVKVLLHVGWGTFRPIRAATVDQHEMFLEPYQVSTAAAETLNTARRRGGRVVAVGTSVVRTLETVADSDGTIHPGVGETALFITPGYRFRAVDALLTNFHTPRSTPLLLACAFACPSGACPRRPESGASWQVGRDRLFALYREAIARRYRLFSYGDAMLLYEGT